MKKITCLLMIFSSLLLASCRIGESDQKPSPLPPISAEMRNKAKEVKAIITPGAKEIGMFISMNTIALYWAHPEYLAERLALPGVTDVYFEIRLSVLNDSNYYPALRKIIAAIHAVKIKCHIVIEDEMLYSADNEDHDARRTVSAIKSYNWYSPRNSEFDGIVAVVNPHHIVSSNVFLKHGLLYSWQDSNFGKNHENDMIMRQAFQILEEIKTAASPMSLTVITENFYHEHNKKGDLSLGNINDFCKYTDSVIIIDYAKYAKEAFGLVKDELKDCNKNQSVMICLRTDRSMYGENAEAVSFSRKKWSQMTTDLTALIKYASAFKSYRGICFRDFDGFELLLEKNN